MEPEISIVVPLFDESENVAPLVDRILAALRDERRELELILVDDGSADQTWHRIGQAKHRDPRIRGIRHLQNAGQSASLWTGFQASRGQIIATLDGDLQNDPADLPRMLAVLEGCDLVCGVRTKRMDSALRRLSTRIARAARKRVLGVDFQDTGCNLRVFKRSILELLPRFNGLHRFMPVLAHSAGASVKEVPVIHHARVAGRSKYGVWNRLGRGIYDLIGVRWFQKRLLKKTPTIEHEEQSASSKAPFTG
jgi:dolichol-phosphate mannosyltransferase